ncbi:DUF6074 family protein [Bradyrhizobium lablabi]|uniref:DUF6074 family protein n=1 Tax=Bradyrhizobium lablabi TaxID=722472 RepID=UPI001BA9CF2C|nr:DUF6074 family protein [Bradyrhizobium lablabi]MBR0697742.1 hypothetical protein [Bradyrhizobium lablabi]
MADVIPFPVTRRQAFVFKQAEHAALMNPDAGERYVLRQVKVQRDAMRRKGVPEQLIERELRSLENAIRDALQRLLIGGVA